MQQKLRTATTPVAAGRWLTSGACLAQVPSIPCYRAGQKAACSFDFARVTSPQSTRLTIKRSSWRNQEDMASLESASPIMKIGTIWKIRLQWPQQQDCSRILKVAMDLKVKLSSPKLKSISRLRPSSRGCECVPRWNNKDTILVKLVDYLRDQ